MTTFTARLRSLRLLSAGTATVTAAALLLTGCSGDAPGTPACRAVHSKTGDLVPPGARPCVVYGTGPADGGTAGHNVPAGSSGSRTPAKAKPPTAPKAPTMPKAPAVKAPAPAVKAPSLVKVR